MIELWRKENDMEKINDNLQLPFFRMRETKDQEIKLKTTILKKENLINFSQLVINLCSLLLQQDRESKRLVGIKNRIRLLYR